jgi:predicted  nucleic acid-binding Zn-ribbon protein
MENTASLVATLKQIIQYSKQLHLLLQQDRQFFAKDDIHKINESNQKKEELLNKISQLSAHLTKEKGSTNSSHHLIALITEKAAQYPAAAQAELTALTKELENEIVHCYQHMATNNNVIYATMQHLKKFWDGVLAKKNDLECVYDHTGHTEK